MVRLVPSLLPAALAAASAFTAVGAAVTPSIHDQLRSRESTKSLNTRQQSSGNGTFWLGNMEHQGISAFGENGYQVFRNVKDFGAKGDGSTDDTVAIQAAIGSGNRCGAACLGDTTTPALVYFPPGTYLISEPIFDYFYTHIIGDANDLPVIKGAANFNGGFLIDSNPYFTADLNWISTTVFFRTIRNLILDMTDIPAGQAITGIHWPTAQATSLQNMVFQMTKGAESQQMGIFCESGSAGFMGDLTFNGGNIGAGLGNQQFTMRNLTFNNANTAISHYWDWGWTYKSVTINNCKVGIDISAGGPDDLSVGSLTLLDSSFTNTDIGILTSRTNDSFPITAGSVMLENVAMQGVPVAVGGPNGTVILPGGGNIEAWGQGHKYSPNGPNVFQDSVTANTRPASLVDSKGAYVEISKPQYEGMSADNFKSVRSGGAKGDGKTDDTAALQKVLDSAASAGQIVFFDAGTYIVTKTLKVPAGSKIVGEALPVIMSSGEFFNDMSKPQPVIQVGEAGETGQVEWSDMIVATQGPQAGAILIEWNLASTVAEPSGMWEVHARVGGFAGSMQQAEQCMVTPNTTVTSADQVNKDCIAAYMLMHITESASGLYLENTWFWVADHDIDAGTNGQITIYSGRGMNIESKEGNIWLSGTSVEHNVLYEYQLVNTKNVYMGQIQTESAYYQPNPVASIPFPAVEELHDPDFAKSCKGKEGNCEVGWGLRVVDSTDILVYGAGLYSFFINNDASCVAQNSGMTCQNSLLSVEGDSSVSIYNLNTCGSDSMADIDGMSVANWADNRNVFVESIALFRNA